MNDKLRELEYSALRDELLILIGKAFDIWKWSVISPFAFAGALLVVLSAENNMLAMLIKEYPIGTPALILGIVTAVSLVLATLVSDLEETRDRLGSYLAVFHDFNAWDSDSSRRSIGYHVWNRIAQMTASELERKTLAPRTRLYSLSMRFWVYPILTLVVGILLAMLVSGVIGHRRLEAVWIAGGLAGFVWAVVHFFGQKGRTGLTYWTARWVEIRSLSAADFSSALSLLNLPASLGEEKPDNVESIEPSE